MQDYLTECSFHVQSFDVDAFEYLQPARLAGYMQEAAGQSADRFGFGLAELQRRGVTWVVVRQQLVIDRPIRVGETLKVETWPAGVHRRAAMRDYRLVVEGLEVGRAISTWYILDLETRKPVMPETVLPEAFHAPSPHVMEPASDHIHRLKESTLQRRFCVRFSDIDVNHHVTNATYVSWATETIEECIWRDYILRELDVQFLAECPPHNYVLAQSAMTGDTQSTHSIIRESDGKELARARATWARR